MSAASLSALPAFDAEKNLRVVIETPKGSRNKYAYDSASGGFELRTVLPVGMSFPYDFGFIPSTSAEDGDPLDILVLMDSPVIPGCLLAARVLGVIEAEQKENGRPPVRNDRLIAVAVHSRTHEGATSLKDLRAHLLEEIQSFFESYNRLHGKSFRALGSHGPKRALALVEDGRKRYAKKKK